VPAVSVAANVASTFQLPLLPTWPTSTRCAPTFRAANLKSLELYASNAIPPIPFVFSSASRVSDEVGSIVVPFLKQTALGAANEDLARAAVEALASGTGEPWTDALLQIFKGAKSADVRRAALESLIEKREKEAVKTLTPLLRDEKDAEMKRVIISELGSTKSDEAIPVLLEVAKKDADIDIRREAVSALGEIGTPKAREALVEILKTKIKDGAER